MLFSELDVDCCKEKEEFAVKTVFSLDRF